MRQQPLQELPVAAHPAVAAGDVHVVAGGVLFVEFHVTDERGPGMARLQQVVAEHGVFRKASVHRGLERIHLIDSLADESAFLKEVLIDIGHRPGVGIDARIARKQADKPGPPGTRQAHSHAGLENAVAFDHNPALGIEYRMVQRMGHGAHQSSGGVTRQLGVGIERDDIFDQGEDGGVADDFGKALAATAAQQGIEVRELPPLAFVTHPAVFAGVPAAWAVKQEEPVVVGGLVLAVEHSDSGASPLDQLLIFRQMLRPGVAEIGEQREVQVLVPIGQIMNLQGFDQAIRAGHARQHGGNDHHRAATRRDAVGIVQTREQTGVHQQPTQPVHQRHPELAGCNHETRNQ